MISAFDLFSGAGGFSTGFRDAGFTIRAAVECQPDAADTYAMNHPDTHMHLFTRAEAVRNAAIPGVDVLLASPPCQGFSVARSHRPAAPDPRNNLWKEVVRYARATRAFAVVVENVPPFLSSVECLEMMRQLTRDGFRVSGKVLNATDFGVAQNRRRTFILAVRRPHPGHQPLHFPDPATKTPYTVRDAIGDLAARPEVLRSFPDGYGPFSGQQLHRTTSATPSPDEMNRLEWDRPANTLTTRLTTGRNRLWHPDEPRTITLLEAARLQGFGDDYKWCGSRTQIAVQIGNAVPPPLAHALAVHLRDAYFQPMFEGGMTW